MSVELDGNRIKWFWLCEAQLNRTIVKTVFVNSIMSWLFY